MSRNRADLDAFVTALAVGRLGRTDAVDLLRPPDDSTPPGYGRGGRAARPARHRSRRLRRRMLDREQFHRITERLRPLLAAAQARARVVDSSPVLAGLADAPDVEAAWQSLSLARRRAVVDLLLTVRVLRTQPGARTFDPACIEIAWRTPS